jgi:phosphoenolpyruvate-protein kinase (PTS system EI component)
MIAPVLVGLGIRELSMSAVSVPEVKAMVRATRTSETEALVQRIAKLGTAAEVRAMVADYVFGLTPHPGTKGRA